MRLGTIYCIQHETSGKMYIGQTIQFKTRIRQHFSGFYNCLALKRAIAKHGKESFKVAVLHENVPEEFLSDLERLCIWISDIQIGQCAKGNPKHKSAGGYHWRYATEEESIIARRAIHHC